MGASPPFYSVACACRTRAHVEMSSGSQDRSIAQALTCFRAGDLGRAAQILDNVLADQPDNFNALHLLGILHAIGGDNDQAEILYRKALHVDPDHGELRVNLALALLAGGKFEEALTHIRAALSLNEKNAVAHFTCGTILGKLKRHVDAITSFDRALAINPGYARARAGRGSALGELKRFDEALAEYDKALSIDPRSAETWSSRGNVLGDLERYGEALESFDRALGIDSGSTETWTNRGVILGELKRFGEALTCFDKALSIDRGNADTWYNRGIALRALKRHDEAIACLDKALGIDPGHAGAWHNRGIACSELARYDDAVANYARALTIDPDLAYCLGNWLYAKMTLCDWDGLEGAYDKGFEQVERDRPAFSPLTLLVTPATASLQKKCAEIYVKDQLGRTTEAGPVIARHEDRKIRIGYFSADFKTHPVSYLAAGMFESHDRNRFEVFGFGLDHVENDEMRRRVVSGFDRFIDLSALDTAEAVGRARKIGLDIAIDLNGHTSGARTDIFGNRVAPVQINYLGYPGTMGARFIDYIVADETVIPREQQIHYAEKVVYLRGSFLVNDDKRRIAQDVPSRAAAGLPERGFVFCSFNNPAKIAPAVFSVWLRLLHKIEHSILWLTPRHPTTGENLRRMARAGGVAPDRLVFAERVASNGEHLARHRLADLFLDTLPYNAHSTAADALWAGLPVLTCIGPTFSGRVGASLLSAIGLPELITGSLEEYESLALELATDPLRLSALMEKLQRHRLTYPLFDTASFTKRIEHAYTQVWERHRDGLPPDHIHVQS